MMDELPGDILRLVAAWPECQLRHVCTRFWREIQPVSFSSAAELVKSRWYKKHVHVLHGSSDYLQHGVFDTKTGSASSHFAVLRKQAPYIFMSDGLSVVSCLLIWDAWYTAAPGGCARPHVIQVCILH